MYDLYRIILLIIIIISLGQILLSYTANTHTPMHAHVRAHTAVAVQLTPLFVAGRSFIQINTRAGDTVSASFRVLFASTKIARQNRDANS